MIKKISDYVIDNYIFRSNEILLDIEKHHEIFSHLAAEIDQRRKLIKCNINTIKKNALFDGGFLIF